MRPEGWVNPYEPVGADLKKMGNQIAFETGADAMLEGLKKEGVRVQWGDCSNLHESYSDRVKRNWVEYGYLVFIEE